MGGSWCPGLQNDWERGSSALVPTGGSPPPICALAGPGLSVLPPAGGERQSLQQQQQLGLWVIVGFLTFLVLEKLFLDSKGKEETSQVSPKPQSLHTGQPSFCGGARAWRPRF